MSDMNDSSRETGSFEHVDVNRGFESLGMLKQRIKDGTFREILEDWAWIFSYSKRYRFAILFFFLIGLSGTLTGQVSALVNIRVVDIVTNKVTTGLPLLIAVSVISMIFSLTVNNYISRLSLKIGIDIGNDIQADIFDKIIDADWLSINRFSNGDILNRFSGDIGTVSDNAVSWIPGILLSLINFAIVFVIMFRMDPIMGCLAFASAPFTLLISRVVIKKQRAYGNEVRKMSSDVMSFEVETFYNFDTIKSFGIAHRYSAKLREWQKRFKKMQLDYNMFSIKTGVYMSLVGYAVSSVCYFYCLYLYWHGKITIGEMGYLITYRSTLSGAFSRIISVVPSFLNTSISAHRVRELVELPKEVHIPDSGQLDAYAEDGFTVKMEDVSYAYVENNRVITDSDFVAKPGEIVALVGPSGEGKTTMIRLILGLAHCQEGRTFLKASNGLEVNMNVETRHLFSYVPQGNTILQGTIAENLRMVEPEATDEQLQEALEMACAWDFVSKLPDGIYSRIGERGKGFSEGQAQRIAIARAILRNSPILLLDEATSALDVTTERQVLRNIVKQRPNKTIIVTTHRPSVLNLCQRVYRVMETRVTELSEEESAKMAIDF